MAEFPSESFLERVLKFGVMNYNGGASGLRFRQWTEEEALPFSLALTAWFLLEGVPIHLWERVAFEEIIEKFGFLLDIDLKTLARR